MKLKQTLVAGLLATVPVSVMAGPGGGEGLQCIDQQTITSMDAGWNNNDFRGPNGGNSVIVYFSDGTSLPMNWRLNADDNGGRNMLELLRIAFADNLKVSVWDHDRNNCDDFDQVRIFARTPSF